MIFKKTVEPNGEITYHSVGPVDPAVFAEMEKFNGQPDNTQLHAWIEANCQIVAAVPK